MDDKKSKKDNPYSDDVRPSFLSGKEIERKKGKGGFFGFGSKKERSSSAADDLSDSEEGALDEDEFGQEGGISSARQSEEKAGGFYSGGDKKKGVGKKSQSKFNILKRGGPTFGIFGVIAGMGSFMYGAQSLMPVAIEEMIIEKFNSIGISSTMASDAWLNTQLNLGVRMEKLKNRSSSNNNGYGGSTVDDATWSEYVNVTIALGGSDAPLMWETPRDGVSWVQGATISEDYYIYALTGHVDNDGGHPNGRIVVVDRETGQQVIPNIVPNSRDLNTLHYDYVNDQIWAQTGNGEANDLGIRGQCYDPSTGVEVVCATYGPRPYAATEGSGYSAQGRDAVNGVGFLAVWKESNDLAIIRICSATSDCTAANTITINGFAGGEIEDLGFDSNGDMVLIFNRWGDGNTRLSYYKISSSFLKSNFNIDTVPLGNRSVINANGSTGGGGYVNDYSDVTIIGDSISTDTANGVNGSGRDLFAEYLPGSDYGDEHVSGQVARYYDGAAYGILQYGKSFKADKSGNASGISVLNTMLSHGDVGNYVLFLLGTNDNSGTTGWLTDGDIDTLMNAVGPNRKVVLMTNYVHSGRGWNFEGDGKNNAVIRNAVTRYPGRIAVADWGSITNDSDIRDNGDGVKNFHFTEAGGEKFVQEVKRALDSIRISSSGSSSSGSSSGSWSGGSLNSSTAELFAFSEFQVEQFEKQGIKVVTGINVGPDSATALLYKKGIRYVPVVGSDYIGSDGLVDAIMMASGMSNIGNPVTASTALADKDFKIPYTTASKAWRGGVSGWFDNIMTTLTETKLSLNRNRWAKYITGEIKGLNKQFMEIAADYDLKTRKSLDDGVDVDIDTDDGRQAVLDVEVEGSNEKINVGDDVVSAAKASSSTSFAEGLSNVLNSKAVKAAAAISEYACALTEGLISIYTVVSAYQNLQFLNLVSGFLESVDKVKAGDGANSPVDDYANNLTTPGTTVDDNGNTIPKKGTALMSAGMAFLFSGSPISQDDDSVRSVNLETILANSSKFLKDVEGTVRFNETCGWIKAGTAAVDLVATIVSFIPYVGQAVKVVQVSANVIAKAAIKTAVQIALHALIPVIVKKVTKTLISNAATEWFGEDLGNALVSGAGKYLGGNGTSGGQSPGSREKVLGYLRERDTVIAEEAEYQRTVRSPFDLTSKYTFLGSLYYSLIPFAYSGNGFMKSLTASSSIVKSSLVALSPTASAIGEEEMNLSSGDCGVLGMAHAAGDAFCNPYIITDTSTMAYSPIAVYNLVHDMRSDDVIAANSSYRGISSANFNSDGSIVEGSSLHRYIVYCGERTSQYGIKDASIYESIMGKNSLVTNVAGAIPILGDVIDIGSGVKEEVNAQWINGSACVATGDSEENDKWESEYKYYQRYAENMRLVENMNPGYKSEITALLEKHYTENPIDQSFEGTLARFSGMSKEQVEDTLALMEYYEFLDEYEPSERYAFVKPAESEPLLFDNDNKLAKTYYILLNQISYSDVRNRTFAV